MGCGGEAGLLFFQHLLLALHALGDDPLAGRGRLEVQTVHAKPLQDGALDGREVGGVLRG